MCDFLKDAWRRLTRETGGIVPVKEVPPEYLGLAVLREQQWSPRFEELMRNRLLFGSFRYGCLEEQRKHGGMSLNNIDSAIERLNKYKIDGNTEHLVDAANMCLVAFEVSPHPKKHFGSTDDGIHVRKE